MKPPSPGSADLLVFFTSFSILAYEINFTRVFAYAQWHNMSALIITVALLGFGASGAVIAMVQKIKPVLPRYMFGAALLFPVSLCLGFVVSALLDINPYEMTFSFSQAFLILVYFGLMGMGFFPGAALICMALMRYRIARTYFANLMGAATGVVFVLWASFFFHPYDIMTGIIIIALVPPGLLAHGGGRVKKVCAVLCLILTPAVLILSSTCLDLKQVSVYKPVSGALALPGARVDHEAYSPMGVVQVVQARGLRATGGLSLASPFQVPVQKLIFFNGEGPSPILPPGTGSAEYLRFLTDYLPFHLARPGRALILGAGGGASIHKSLLAGFDRVDALEANPNVIDLMTGALAPFSGEIFRHNRVRVYHGEARHFIRQTREEYDLIELSLMDAYNAAASGVYGLHETYLYTTEAIKDYMNRLTEKGILAFTRWVVTPARDNLKLFNTVVTALKEMGIQRPQDHLMAIRSLQTLTLVVLKTKPSAAMVEKAREFAGARFFDLVHYPGMPEGEANRHIRLDTPVYYQAMKHLLGRDAASFIRKHLFDIRAPTDNRPYYYNFFRPGVIQLIRDFGPAQVPVTEWGYLLLLILLVPVLALSFLLIPAPILFFKSGSPTQKGTVFTYFSCIGAGFFFIEMVLIQKMTLFLGQPVYAVSLIIAALLFFSGMGSYASDRIFTPGIRMPAAGFTIAGITFLYTFTLDPLFREWIHLGLGQRICLTLLLAAPLGFFMGIPFPAGLNRVREMDPSWVAWAWGINGFFSVISILSAALMAVVFGFKPVLTAAGIFYICAGLSALGLGQTKEVLP